MHLKRYDEKNKIKEVLVPNTNKSGTHKSALHLMKFPAGLLSPWFPRSAVPPPAVSLAPAGQTAAIALVKADVPRTPDCRLAPPSSCLIRQLLNVPPLPSPARHVLLTSANTVIVCSNQPTYKFSFFISQQPLRALRDGLSVGNHSILYLRTY